MMEKGSLDAIAQQVPSNRGGKYYFRLFKNIAMLVQFFVLMVGRCMSSWNNILTRTTFCIFQLIIQPIMLTPTQERILKPLRDFGDSVNLGFLLLV